MARYEVYNNEGGTGYLLDVQSDFLEDLGSRVVVPLLPPSSAPPPAKRLNPVFQLNGKDYVMLTQSLGAIPARELKSSIGNISDQFDLITSALDMLFQGF